MVQKRQTGKRARHPPKLDSGQVVIDGAPVSHQKGRFSDQVIAKARALYEGNPTISYREVSEAIGVAYDTVKCWGSRYKWKKNPLGDLTKQANAAADNYRGNLKELGPEITVEQQQGAEAAAVLDAAIEMRAEVLNRHRKEWNAPRTLSYEAVKARDFEKAKLAKITAETLRLIQDGERKAWGLDTGSGDGKVTVVIERE